MSEERYQPDGQCDQFGYSDEDAWHFSPLIHADPPDQGTPNAQDPFGPQELVSNGGSFGHIANDERQA